MVLYDGSVSHKKIFYVNMINLTSLAASVDTEVHRYTVKILKFGTPQTIPIIVLKKEKFDVTLH